MIDQEKPDLVLAGTHGVTGLTHVFLGSVAERIVRHSTAPVFVVRRSDFPPRAILIPVDREDDGEESLLLASELRNAFNASVELVQVVEAPTPLSIPPDAAPILPPFDKEAALREARVRLRAIASKHPDIPLIEHAAVGQPADEICRKAQQIGADLILMPTQGRKGLPRLLLGSVAEQVVRYAPCHVLTFHPGKFRRG
jgi:nucleotide-binding universal stress UspA family protein